MGYRIEKDSFGEIKVPGDKYWGAQTQRSIEKFRIGDERLPDPLIRALIIAKYCAASSNMEFGVLDQKIGHTIMVVCRELLEEPFEEHFPLKVWQTGSGTQSNMNVNEVIANLANLRLGGKPGSKSPVHPNDHCNLGQSSNDTFPTAMHIAVAEQLSHKLLPALEALASTLLKKSSEWSTIIKIGRTHLQDATPISLGQEFSTFHFQIRSGINRLKDSLPRLFLLPQGGTAVGTGLNTKSGFDRLFAEALAKFTGLPFKPMSNKFEGIATHDAMVEISGVLNTLAVSLTKIGNDIRFLASGPRCGIGELILPQNEPGSSIMPGKVNPTQIEALTMVCAQVVGNHTTVTFAGSQGHFQLNAFKPVIAYNVLQSVRLLSDSINSFNEHCATGIQPDLERIKQFLHGSLMLVTALTPAIGYEKAAKIAQEAEKNGTTLREEAIRTGWIDEEEYDKLVDPTKMISPHP